MAWPLVVAAVVQGIGSLLGGEADKQKARAKRKQMQAEAALRELQAKEELRKTYKQIDISKKRASVALGDQVSMFAKAGVNVSDSALLVIGSNQFELEQERVEIQRQGEMNARFIREGAALLRQEAKASKAGEGMQTAGTVLGAVGKIAGSLPGGD
jgi:hypothetical protein